MIKLTSLTIISYIPGLLPISMPSTDLLFWDFFVDDYDHLQLLFGASSTISWVVLSIKTTFSSNGLPFWFVCFFLSFHKKSKQIDSTVIQLEIISSFTQMFWAFAFIFLLCYFGELITKQFNEFDEQLFQCDWYSYPIEMQILYSRFILYSQQPTYIQGYGGTFCTRDNFRKVWIPFDWPEKILINLNFMNFCFYQTIYTGFSYYMTLRQISAWNLDDSFKLIPWIDYLVRLL